MIPLPSKKWNKRYMWLKIAVVLLKITSRRLANKWYPGTKLKNKKQKVDPILDIIGIYSVSYLSSRTGQSLIIQTKSIRCGVR